MKMNRYFGGGGIADLAAYAIGSKVIFVSESLLLEERPVFIGPAKARGEMAKIASAVANILGGIRQVGH